MADDVVVRLRADSADLIRDLEKQIQLLRETGRESDKSSRKAESNAAKRSRLLREESQDLRELKKRRDQAFDPDDIDAYNRRIRETERRVKNLKGEYGKLEKTSGRLSSAFAKLGGAIFAAFSIDRLVRFGAEAVELAGKMEGVRQAFNNLNDPRLLKNLRDATRGTITDLELMQKAVQATNLQVPIEQLATFFEFATVRAAQTGESVDYLVDSIVTGIGRKSIRVIDNLGISAEQVRQKLGGVGIEAASVTDIADALGEIIEEEMTSAGDAVLTTAQKTARLNAELQNQKTVLGENLTPAWNEFLDIASKSLFVLNQSLEAGKIVKYADAMDNAKKIADDVARTFDNISNAVKNTTDSVEDQDIRWAEWGMQLESSIQGAKDRIKEYQEGFGQMSVEEYDRTTQVLIPMLENRVKAYEEVVEMIDSEREELKNKNDTQEETIQLTDKELKQLLERKMFLADLAALEERMLGLRRGRVEDPGRIGPIESGGEAYEPDRELAIPAFIDIDPENEVGIEGFKEATEEMLDAGYESWEQYFQWQKDQARESAQAQKQLYEQAFRSIGQVVSNQIRQQAMDQEAAAAQERERQAELARQKFEIGVITEQQLNEKLLEIDQNYDEERKRIQREEAERQKTLATFEAIINTAAAIAKALPNVALSVAAGIAGAAQIAVIQSQPVPQFAEGTDYLKPWMPGQGNSVDDIPVMANKGEAIIPTDKNKEHPGLAKAWISGNVDDWIFKNYAAPEIEKHLTEFERIKEKDFASNIAQSLMFNDSGIVKAIGRSTRAEIKAQNENFEALGDKLRTRKNRRL